LSPVQQKKKGSKDKIYNFFFGANSSIEEAKMKEKKARLLEEKNQKEHKEVRTGLKSVKAQIQEDNFTQAIASLKTIEKIVKSNKFLNEFKPEISEQLKFCENTTYFRTEKEKFWEIYKSGAYFIGAYNGISKLKSDVEQFPENSKLIHPLVVSEINEVFNELHEEYEEQRARYLAGNSSIGGEEAKISKLSVEFENKFKSTYIKKRKNKIFDFFFGENASIEEAKIKERKAWLLEENIKEKRWEVEKELNTARTQIQEGKYTEAIETLKISENIVKKNKFLREFKPEIDEKLKFCENTTHFRSQKEKFWDIYKSGKNFMESYDSLSKLKNEVDKFPENSELIHPSVVSEVNDAFQVLKGEYEERKANFLSDISSISNISNPKDILDLEPKFSSLEKDANSLKMGYILPKINDQRIRYMKNLEFYREKENLQLIFKQGDIIQANFGITKLNKTIDELKRESGENYIYSTIALDISEFSIQVQAEIHLRNASLYELNAQYEIRSRMHFNLIF